MLPYVIGLFASLVVLCYYLLIKPHNYWKNRGVEVEKPLFIFGNWKPVAFKKLCASEYLKLIYDKYPGKRCVPLFQFMKPILLLRDPDLIKHVAVKNHDTFLNRSVYLSKSADPVAASMMFFLQGDEWRNVRNTLSPAFTTNKLKSLYNLIIDCSQQFSDYFEQNSKPNTVKIVEMKEEFLKIANDVVTTTAFGLKTDSLKNPNNELFTNGKNLIDLSGFFNNLKFLLAFINPFFAKIFKVRMSSERVSNFFIDIVLKTIKFRKENGVTRPDMMQLMIDIRKEALHDEKTENLLSTSKTCLLTDEMLAAQCMVFYFAGFDTLSTTLSFLSYELALNPNVQQRLFEEISETFESFNQKIPYEAMVDMKYLDMVVSESLRKWPSAGLLERCPIKPFNLSLDGENHVCIDENVVTYISPFAMQRDPSHWPDPENFDPERFSDDNKGNIKPYTYMPFGVGPRSCIANRFALLAEKSIIAHLLYKFEIIPVEKTAIPLKLCGHLQGMLAGEEYWLGLKPRQAVYG